MKYLVISDIHSNLESFEKLLNIKKVKEVDRILFLGDLVGYGANPNEVIELFRSLKNVSYIRGNHDKVVAGIESSSLFNPVAAFSAEWSRNNTSKDNLEFLKNIDIGPKIVDYFSTICHGSTFDEDYYVFSVFEASESIKFMETSVGFFGHTHIATHHWIGEDMDVHTEALELGQPVVFNPIADFRRGIRRLLNPGSVGQPRDGDPRASFAQLVINGDPSDEKTRWVFTVIRQKYDIDSVVARFEELGLPPRNGTRLRSGT